MAGKRKRLSGSNQRGMAAITVIVVILLVVLTVKSHALRVENAQYAEQKAELEQELQDEEVRAEEIANLSDYVNSDEYIEKVAREKLGLVYEDEIIFKAEED